jgi:beta-1,4-N-acetylglucosaminyltransferase
MIFVTVGTTHFDDLIREVDRLAECGVMTDPVYAQIGSGKYIPRYTEWVRFLPNLRQIEKSATLVICHGGTGSVFELLEMGKPFIAVPNRALKDDHQSDFLHAVEAEGWCTCCWELSELGPIIANRKPRTPYSRECTLAKEIWQYLLPDSPSGV